MTTAAALPYGSEAVYQPQADTHLLIAAVRSAGRAAGARALDLCTGSGAVAVGVADAGAASVLAVDRSSAAVAAARSLADGRPIAVREASVTDPELHRRLGGQTFNVITCNPPYVPAPEAGWPTPPGQPAHAWDAGPRGRDIIEPLCARVADLLSPGGVFFLVQSSVAAPAETMWALRCAGLHTDVGAAATIPFGPVMTGRAGWLTRQGLIRPGQRWEDLVVIRAERARI